MNVSALSALVGLLILALAPIMFVIAIVSFIIAGVGIVVNEALDRIFP